MGDLMAAVPKVDDLTEAVPRAGGQTRGDVSTGRPRVAALMTVARAAVGYTGTNPMEDGGRRTAALMDATTMRTNLMVASAAAGVVRMARGASTTDLAVVRMAASCHPSLMEDDGRPRPRGSCRLETSSRSGAS